MTNGAPKDQSSRLHPFFARPVGSPYVAYTPAERWGVLFILLALGATALPFSLAANESGRLLVYGSFLLYLGILSLPFISPKFHPGVFHPVAFYVVWVALQGLLRGEFSLPISGLEFHRAIPASGEFNLNGYVAKSFLLESMAVVSLYAGYAISPRVRIRLRPPKGVCAPALTSVIWVTASGAAVAVLASHSGGLDQLLMQRGIPSDQRVGARVGAHWHYIAGLGLIAPIVWLACEKTAIRRPIFWAILCLAIAINFAATGSRGSTILPLIIIGAIYVLQHRVIPYRFALIGAIVAVTAIGTLGQYRATTMQVENFQNIKLDTGPMDWLAAGWSEMQRQGGENNGQIAVVSHVPHEVPHLWGESYLAIPFAFVPSAMWGDKPHAGGRHLSTQIYKNPRNTIPPQSVGEAYWNFSYVGVIAIFMLYGLSLKIAASLYTFNPRHPLALIIFLLFIFKLEPSSDAFYSALHAIAPAIFVYASFISRSRHENIARPESVYQKEVSST